MVVPTASPDLIALISGVASASPPAMTAVSAELPDATLWNLIDDRLISDAVRDGGVTERLVARMARLVGHAAEEGADAVLMTCSIYAFAADELSARAGIPVLGPDDAAMAAIAAAETRSIIVVSGVELALNDSTARFRAVLAAANPEAKVHPVLAVQARRPSLERDVTVTADRIAEAIETSGLSADAVFLANYSLAFAADAVQARVGRPVLTGPASAARALRERLSPQLKGSD